MSEPLIGGSLFTGYGGLDMAADRVLGPLDFAWHSDIKPASKVLLEYRYPGVPNLGDITTLDPQDVSPVHLLTFGWPCQPHSAAGKRLGEADPRALWPHVHRIIDGLRPPLLLGENVSRVATNGELRRVVRSLAEIGYVGLWRSVRASDVGAPHRRDRLFLLGFRAGSLNAVADAVTTYSGSAKLRDQPGRSCRTCGPGTGVAGDDGPEREAGLSLLPTPTARHGDERRGSPSSEVGARRLASGRRNLEDSVAAHLTPLLPTPRATDGTKGGWNQTATEGGPSLPAVACSVARWGHYAAAIERWESILGRAAPTPALPTGRDGQMQLAPAFVEWMTGLPAGWVTDVPGLTRAQMLSLLGDGVVPQQGTHAFDQLVDDVFAVQSVEVAS